MNIVSSIKNNLLVYNFYYYTVSFLVNVLRIFVKTDNKLILFVSFGGRYFNDNPNVLYDAMLQDERYRDYKVVWAFLKPEQIEIKTPKIKINSFNIY